MQEYYVSDISLFIILTLIYSLYVGLPDDEEPSEANASRKWPKRASIVVGLLAVFVILLVICVIVLSTLVDRKHVSPSTAWAYQTDPVAYDLLTTSSFIIINCIPSTLTKSI